jgi:hypothetical protein
MDRLRGAAESHRRVVIQEMLKTVPKDPHDRFREWEVQRDGEMEHVDRAR